MELEPRRRRRVNLIYLLGGLIVFGLMLGVIALISTSASTVGGSTVNNTTTNITTNNTTTVTSVTSITSILNIAATIPFMASAGYPVLGDSVVLTNSYLEITPSITQTPINMTGYNSFRMYSVVTTPSAPAPLVQVKSCTNGSHTTTATCAFTARANAGDIIAVAYGGIAAILAPTSITDNDTGGSNTYTKSFGNGVSAQEASVWYATVATTDTLLITAHCTVDCSGVLVIYDLEGVSISGVTGNVGGSLTPSTSYATASFTAQVFTIAVVSTSSNPTFTAGTGYIAVTPTFGAGGEYSSTVTGTNTAPMTSNAAVVWTEAAESFGAGAFTMNMKVQYSTNAGSTWTDLSASTLSISPNLVSAYVQSSYYTIAVGAKGDYLFRFVASASIPVTISVYKLGVEIKP